MNCLKTLRNLFIMSFILSMVGFLFDLRERVPNLWVNIFEIIMMMAIIFSVFASIYLLSKFILNAFKRIFTPT